MADSFPACKYIVTHFSFDGGITGSAMHWHVLEAHSNFVGDRGEQQVGWEEERAQPFPRGCIKHHASTIPPDPQIPFTSTVILDSVMFPYHWLIPSTFRGLLLDTRGASSMGTFMSPHPPFPRGSYSQWWVSEYKSPALLPEVGQTLKCCLYSRAAHTLGRLFSTLAKLHSLLPYWFFLGILL